MLAKICILEQEEMETARGGGKEEGFAISTDFDAVGGGRRWAAARGLWPAVGVTLGVACQRRGGPRGCPNLTCFRA